MTTRNLDFFSTFLEGSQGNYELTPAAVKRAILDSLGRRGRLRYKALWKDMYDYGTSGRRFTDALRELRRNGVIVLDTAGTTDPSDPDVVLTPAGVIAADALVGLE